MSIWYHLGKFDGQVRHFLKGKPIVEVLITVCGLYVGIVAFYKPTSPWLVLCWAGVIAPLWCWIAWMERSTRCELMKLNKELVTWLKGDNIACTHCEKKLSREESRTARIWGGFHCPYCKRATKVTRENKGWRIQKWE